MDKSVFAAARKAFFLAIAAGIFIGIGGTVLLSCDNRYMGAGLFTVALLSICMMGLFLYTGKVGFLVDAHGVADLCSVGAGLLGNAAGTFLAAASVGLIRPALRTGVQTLVEGKLQQLPYQTLLSGVMCGILMYTAVYVFREKNSSLGILFCVPVFILAGFEHSIADMFYFILAGCFSWHSLCFLLLVILGNSIGGMLIPLLRRFAGDTN